VCHTEEYLQRLLTISVGFLSVAINQTPTPDAIATKHDEKLCCFAWKIMELC